MNDILNTLSSEELFKMAEQRKVAEEALRQDAIKGQIAELRAQIRKLDAQYKKDRAAIEAEIAKLSGKTAAKPAAPVAAKDRTPGISARIVEIVKTRGEISSKDINTQLKDDGIKPKNLSQTMSYLKKKGKVLSIGHGMYRAG